MHDKPFPETVYIVRDSKDPDEIYAYASYVDLDLDDGEEVAVYRLDEVKTLQVTRQLTPRRP